MNEFSINYGKSKSLKYVYLSFSILSLALGVYICITKAINKDYSFIFFYSLFLVLFAAGLILFLTKWEKSPIIKIDNESINTNFPEQKPILCYWKDIKKINIGISSLIIETANSGNFKIELDTLIYKDLKETKSKIIELCENRNIPFSNI